MSRLIKEYKSAAMFLGECRDFGFRDFPGQVPWFVVSKKEADDTIVSQAILQPNEELCIGNVADISEQREVRGTYSKVKVVIGRMSLEMEVGHNLECGGGHAIKVPMLQTKIVTRVVDVYKRNINDIRHDCDETEGEVRS